ncbi:receptor-type tyrosine-protein phosphatase C isoform X2 [Labrus bergylta]|uniref:receptor-type tyrosine-protein phosphatase C isoform X2 n=1 Tax=Labrus bergylta TaxID=56723 RepID=UPI0033138F59
MAGLFGLKILLLWAGIIGLANCQNGPATTSPASTLLTSTTNSTSKKTDPQTTTSQNQTSNANTTSSTVAPPTTATTKTPPPCSYAVSTIKFGFKIDITSATTGTYDINIKEEAHPETEVIRVFHSNQTSSHKIKHLKPCTEYKHAVEFNDSAGNITFCSYTGNKTSELTTQMELKDIEDGSCIPGYVCYRSDWNIGSSMSASNNVAAEPCRRTNSTEFCIKPGIDDICPNLTTTFTSAMCMNSSFEKIKRNVDYLNVSGLQPEIPTELPINKIQTKLPQNCSNLNIVHTCLDIDEISEPIKPIELEPFTNYSCMGQIKENNVTIKNTTAIKFNIDCDLTTTITKPFVTNTSVEFSWTTTSQKCKDVLTKSPKLSFPCSCVPHHSKHKHSKSSRGGCLIDGLDPYTNYKCGVEPRYKKKVFVKITSPVETLVGKPADISKPLVTLPGHNEIKVTCTLLGRFYGPGGYYIARLRYGDIVLTQKNMTKECLFTFKDLSYSTTYILEVAAGNKKFEGNLKHEVVTTQYNDKAVIGFLIFLIILTSVALLLVVYKIFILKRRQSHDMSENIKLITTNDEENLLPVEPITAEFLLDAYKRKLADEGRLFLAEFQSIPRIYSRYSVKEAKKPCNAPKNRYVDILPYDHNRVQLATGNGEAGCDYINASFVDGYKESRKYIAAQGPKEETVCDFWRMVWEQQSSIIVMVTRCEEGNRVKCAQYWPSVVQEAEIFEEFIVKLNSEENCPDYIIRRLSLINKREKNSEREVTHIQFISWPDHGVPGEPYLLLKLRRRVNAFKNFFSGPIVIHCSAGVGRTGTYIGIDAMMEGLEAEGRVDIYGYVVRLRRQRCLMVQVEAQYILIHQALLEHNQFGETEITLPELHSTLSTLNQKNSDNESSLLEEEFERLPTFKNWRTFKSGISEENKKKNRTSSVIPYDYNRVLLKLDEGHSRDSEHDEDEEEDSSDEEDEDSTKYINASHIDGYWGPRIFIAAQTPLPDTMADFWSMVYQKKASTIVMLSDCSEGEKSDCVYWDEDKKIFGDFEVEVASTDITPTFTTRNMLLRHVKRKESRSVKHFQFLKWESKELPEKAQYLTDMIKDIKHSCGSDKSQQNNSTVVHCNDGSSRTGVFCALWNLLDSAETEKLVDVFQVAKTLRKERQGILSSLEEYQFLYNALDGVFPVQNGDVKAAQASAADSVLVVNETKLAAEPDEPASTASKGQQGAGDSTPDVGDGVKEEAAEKVPTETTPLEDSSNGPTVTAEV